ncbi:hypothetical protein ACFX1T_044787 [Malus domestica]
MIFDSSLRHHRDSVYLFEKTMTAILHPSISWSSSLCMFSPLLSWLSIIALIPALRNAMKRWSVKVLRVSSPLKLRNTSYFQRIERPEEDEEEAAAAPWAELLVCIDNWYYYSLQGVSKYPKSQSKVNVASWSEMVVEGEDTSPGSLGDM